MKKYSTTKEFFGGIIQDKIEKENIMIDIFTFELLMVIDGKLEIKDFINKYKDELSYEEIFSLLKDFVEMDLIIPDFDILLNEFDHLSYPFRVFYDITYACNLACKHCFTNSGKQNPYELNLTDKINLVKQCKELNVGRISLAGGEPFYSKDLFPFLEACKNNNIEVSISTNATLLTENMVQELNEYGIRTLTISLDGGEERTSDVIRGKGAFVKSLQGLENLKRFYKYSYSIKTTLMKTNCNDIEKIINIAIDKGCSSVKFNCVREDGRAKNNSSLVMLDQEMYINVIKEIERLRLKYDQNIKIRAPLNVFCDDEYEYIPELGFGCFAGKESMCVDPMGNVRPCSHFPKEFICGNITKDNLSDIWHNSDVLKIFRTLKGNSKCNDCEKYDACRSGCRFRAYSQGDINGIDPYCYLRK